MNRYLTRRCRVALMASAAALAVMAAVPASACKRYPAAPDPVELVRDTKIIVLARVVGIEMDSSFAEFRFKVLKVLKHGGGDVGRFVRTEIRQRSIPPLHGGDFDAHRDPRFWKGEIDRRSQGGTDCLFGQTFRVGRTYLIFRGQRVRRAAELIKSPNDLWLATVRRLTIGK